jgi:hypothetical protein
VTALLLRVAAFVGLVAVGLVLWVNLTGSTWLL